MSCMPNLATRKRSILEFAPADYVETMVQLAVDHPGEPIDELAVERGVPPGIARNIMRDPRFALVIARRGSDTLARDAVPIAVRTLKDMASGRDAAPPAVRVQAARTILQHAERYLAGYLDGAKQEQDLADMSLEELRELVDKGEARLAASARHIAPHNAPTLPDDLAQDVKDALG